MKADDKQIGGDHYKDRKVQHWTYAAQLPYLEGLATKYIDRHRRKGGKEDLRKAIHTIEKMIEEYYPEAPQGAAAATLNPTIATPQEASPARSQGVPGVCPHNSSGHHGWSSVYKHGKAGRMEEVLVCDWCQMEQFKP